MFLRHMTRKHLFSRCWFILKIQIISVSGTWILIGRSVTWPEPARFPRKWWETAPWQPPVPRVTQAPRASAGGSALTGNTWSEVRGHIRLSVKTLETNKRVKQSRIFRFSRKKNWALTWTGRVRGLSAAESEPAGGSEETQTLFFILTSDRNSETMKNKRLTSDLFSHLFDWTSSWFVGFWRNPHLENQTSFKNTTWKIIFFPKLWVKAGEADGKRQEERLLTTSHHNHAPFPSPVRPRPSQAGWASGQARVKAIGRSRYKLWGWVKDVR